MKSYTRRKARKVKHRRAHRGGSWSQFFSPWAQRAAAAATAPSYENIRAEAANIAAAREPTVYNTDSIDTYSIEELREHINQLNQEIERITQEWERYGESARAALQEEKARVLQELEEKHIEMQRWLGDLHATLRLYENALAAKQPPLPPARPQRAPLWAPKQRGVTQRHPLRKGSPRNIVSAYYNATNVAKPSVPKTGVTMRLQNLKNRSSWK